MAEHARSLSRRRFLKAGLAAPALFQIAPRHVLGGRGHTPPSETFGVAMIGCGGQAPGTYGYLAYQGLSARKLAECDVQFKHRVDDETIYTDFRRVLDRHDIDIVLIATPPHWHALISIAAAEAGKDVLCEKPLTRFIAEGRAVVEAFKRYDRILQVGTFGRFRASANPAAVETHKIMRSGLLKACPGVHVQRGGFKVKEWSGPPNLRPEPIPAHLDWDMYVGPSPMKPFVGERVGGTHRRFWDYEGGGLADMGQHYLDPVQWTYAKDDTSPVEIEAFAPPAHPEVTGMWGWVEMRYADGFTLVLDSGEWGSPYDRKEPRGVSLADLTETDRREVEGMPDPAALVSFADAVKTRRQAGGHPEAAHRCATLLHLANIAIRTGRRVRYDPVAERILGDEQADRLVDLPMRAPWHL